MSARTVVVGPSARAIGAACAVALAAAPRPAAAESHALHGIVAAQGSGAPVANASVFTDRGDIAITDEDGFFTIAIDDARDTQLTIVAPRFATVVSRIVPGDQHIELVPVAGAEVIEVHGVRPDDTRPLTYRLTADDIRALPGAGGDALRALQILPGVSRIPFSFGGLVLRGASPRDTAVFIDGTEIPFAFHTGGLVSVYPSDSLADVQLVASGFDASYGRAQGGIVTLTTREPRRDRWRVGGEVGDFESAAVAEGPVGGDGGILLGVRKSYLATIAAPFAPADTPLPAYWDFQARASFGDESKPGGRVAPTVFGAFDSIASPSIAVRDRFVRVAAPWTRHWEEQRATVRIAPWLGYDELAFSDVVDAETYSRPSYKGGARAEVQRDTTFGNWRGGVEASAGFLSHENVEVGPNGLPTQQLAGTSSLTWTDLAMWSDAQVQLDDDRFIARPGVRVESFGLTGEVVLDPRVSIVQVLDADRRWRVRQSLGRYHQPPTPADVDPEGGNPKLTSSYTDQATLGTEWSAGAWFASLTGFYGMGWSQGVKAPRPELTPSPTSPDLGGLGPTFELLLEKELGFPIYRTNAGRARDRGLELLVKHAPATGLAWMVAYTLAEAERTEHPRQHVGWRPFELDQRHDFNAVASYPLGSHWRIGARLQVVSGDPYSPSVGGAQVPWGGRLPTFFALDLRAERRWHRCWGDILAFVDLQNATNHVNVEGRTPSDTGFSDTDVKGLPTIPFVGVSFLPLK